MKNQESLINAVLNIAAMNSINVNIARFALGIQSPQEEFKSDSQTATKPIDVDEKANAQLLQLQLMGAGLLA